MTPGPPVGTILATWRMPPDAVAGLMSAKSTKRPIMEAEDER